MKYMIRLHWFVGNAATLVTGTMHETCMFVEFYKVQGFHNFDY